MVRDYKRKSEQQKWLESNMKAAVAKVRSKEMSLGDAAQTYGVPKTTLFRRARKNCTADKASEKGLGRFR